MINGGGKGEAGGLTNEVKGFLGLVDAGKFDDEAIVIARDRRFDGGLRDAVKVDAAADDRAGGLQSGSPTWLANLLHISQEGDLHAAGEIETLFEIEVAIKNGFAEAKINPGSG